MFFPAADVVSAFDSIYSAGTRALLTGAFLGGISRTFKVSTPKASFIFGLGAYLMQRTYAAVNPESNTMFFLNDEEGVIREMQGFARAITFVIIRDPTCSDIFTKRIAAGFIGGSLATDLFQLPLKVIDIAQLYFFGNLAVAAANVVDEAIFG